MLTRGRLTADRRRASRLSLAELQLAVLHSEDSERHLNGGKAADMMDVSVAEDVGKNALC